MDSQQFASSYQREVPQYRSGSSTVRTTQDAYEKSATFGRYLHDHLSDTAAEQPFPEFQASYTNWKRHSFLPHLDKVIHDTRLLYPEQPVEEGQLRQLNELTFHLLNFNLLPMWQSLLEPTASERNPGQFAISLMQGHLALMGMPFFSVRAHNGEAYFTPEYKEKRGSIEGILTEIDATIVLLEIAKRRPHLHIVPGPFQFESASKNLNSDLIAIDTSNQTSVGVQVKSTANQNAVKHYDKQHVVIVDGSSDLENTIPRPSSTRSSRICSIGWAGLVAATFVRDLPTQGSQGRAYTREHPLQYLMYQKQLTRRTIMQFRSKLPVASQRVENKLAPHLEIS